MKGQYALRRMVAFYACGHEDSSLKEHVREMKVVPFF